MKLVSDLFIRVWRNPFVKWSFVTQSTDREHQSKVPSTFLSFPLKESSQPNHAMWIHEFVNQKEENQFFCVSRSMFQCNFDRNNRLTEIHTDGIYLGSFKDWPTTLLQNYLARHLTFFSKKATSPSVDK